MKTLLETKGLTKEFTPSTGVFEIDITLNAGEIVGFIGPNGAGKSTAMNALLFLLDIDKGLLKYFDQKVETKKDLNKHISKIGFLPSEGGLHEYLTPRKFFMNIASFYKATDRILEKAFNLSSTFELDLNKKISKLSMGNKKKVAFISAIMHSPKILILDEPTSGLDPFMQGLLFTELRKIKEEGGAVMLSSHVLSEVQNICDRLYVIKEGRIIVDKSTKELLKTSKKKIKLYNPTEKIMTSVKETVEIESFVQHSKEAIFLTKDLKALIQLLDKLKFYDFLIEEPTLEENFLKYYENKQND